MDREDGRIFAGDGSAGLPRGQCGRRPQVARAPRSVRDYCREETTYTTERDTVDKQLGKSNAGECRGLVLEAAGVAENCE